MNQKYCWRCDTQTWTLGMIFYPVNDSKWLQEVVFGINKLVPFPDVEVCGFCCRCSIRGSPPEVILLPLKTRLKKWLGWHSSVEKEKVGLFFGGTQRVLHKTIGNNQFWGRFSHGNVRILKVFYWVDIYKTHIQSQLIQFQYPSAFTHLGGGEPEVDLELTYVDRGLVPARRTRRPGDSLMTWNDGGSRDGSMLRLCPPSLVS